MRTPLKMTLALAIPFASLLWVTPPAAARDYHSYGQGYSRSDSYRPSYTRRYNGKNRWKYNKAMNRLARQEREARARAYRRYDGDSSDQRYRQRLAEIDRRYDHKRDKVDRNLRNRW